MNIFHPTALHLTKYLFYTGKGGVGKTSVASATAVALADSGKRVLLISSDPASNLQDVFSIALTNKGTKIPNVPNLVVANLDPIQAASEYRENILAPYRGKLPHAVLVNMEEQLSGSCTVEIAAFNEFSKFITDHKVQQDYDHIIFDTAPTGHTLRMLHLPSAWSRFISEGTHDASCLGPLSGLQSKKTIYKQAMETLSDEKRTTLLLVTRSQSIPFKEAARASSELFAFGIHNQILIVNNMLKEHNDKLSSCLYEKQQTAFNNMPTSLQKLPRFMIPMRAYQVTGIDNVRALLQSDHIAKHTEALHTSHIFTLHDVIDELVAKKKRVIFTMGKGGVGKTTVAAAIAMGLAKRGQNVHLTTTDPAAHLKFVLDNECGISMSHIDEVEELKKYQAEILNKAHTSGMSDADIAYIEEDLRSPCTQEIAVFRAFAQMIDKADHQIVVIDTAPTGHTLLLLESTHSYHHEIKRTKGEIPESFMRLLPRLKSDETEVLIVTLPEGTPVYEAMRLEDDLHRAHIYTKWWIVNQSLYGVHTTNPLLAAKAANETEWLNRINTHAKGNFVRIAWSGEELKNERLLEL